MPPRDDEVQALVEQLSADLDRSVLVDDASLRLLAYSPTLGSEDEVRRTAILTRETPRVIRDLHFAQGIASATQPVRTAPRPDIGLESRVCVPIRCQGALFGYLWLIDADESLTEDDCEAAERTAAEIGTAMYRRDELEKPQRELELRLLEMLFGADAARARRGRPGAGGGDAAGRRRGDRRARDAPAGATPSASSAPSERARLGLALDQFRRTLPRRQALSDGARRPRAMLLAALTSARRHRRPRPRAQEALEGVRGPTRMHRLQRATASTCATPTAPTSTRGLALRVAGALPEHGSPAGWEELGAYRLLARAAETPHAKELIHPGSAEAVRAAEQGIPRADARGLPGQRL